MSVHERSKMKVVVERAKSIEEKIEIIADFLSFAADALGGESIPNVNWTTFKTDFGTAIDPVFNLYLAKLKGEK